MSKPLYVQALDSLRKREWLLRILIFTLVTIVFWIGFSIYLSQSKSKLSVDIQKDTEPLNPNINRSALDELAQRKRYTEQELQQFPLFEVVSIEKGSTTIQEVGSSPAPETTETVTPSTSTTSATKTPTPTAVPVITIPEASPSASFEEQPAP